MKEVKKFTIDEFKLYLNSQDSLGDIHYFLSEENVQKAIDKFNLSEVEEEEEVFLPPPIEEKMYTREEVKNITFRYGQYVVGHKRSGLLPGKGNWEKELSFEDWFQQNVK